MKAIDGAPTIYLAHAPTAQGKNCLAGLRGVKRIPQSSAPVILMSFVYLKSFLSYRKRHDYVLRGWVLDSGAFSAFNIGKTIDIDEYIDTCKFLMANDPELIEIYALDVIGGRGTGVRHKEGARLTLKNTEKMWKAGVPAIPTYHIGEPESALINLAKNYDKIGLGGMKLLPGKKKIEWAAQVFARVWPQKIHGFGSSQEEVLMALPFHSVDSTTWELRPSKFGRWPSFNDAEFHITGGGNNIRSELEHFRKIEAAARRRWETAMQELPGAVKKRVPIRKAPKKIRRMKK